ncbi:MAG TPA: hypothetical protein VFY90_14985 [Tepidiformaceae bacterium]|nr:hypothetical protein [Tepidiformaceae bacterium]
MKKAWEHGMSWWVYPVTALSFLAFVAWEVSGIKGLGIPMLGVRAVSFIALVAWFYDERIRRPRLARKRRR